MKKIIIKKESLLHRIYNHIVIVYDRADDHNLFLIASGIAFNIILYLMPLLLLAVYIVGIIFNVSDVIIYLSAILEDLLPATQSNLDFIGNVLAEVRIIMDNSYLSGWIGVVGLIWVSSLLISSIRAGINSIFKLPSSRYFLVYIVKDIGFTILFTILVLLYSYIIPLLTIVVELAKSILPDVIEGYFTELILFGATVFSAFVLFYFIYRFVPNKKLPKYVIMLSTTISVIFIEIARFAFAFYISSVSDYGKFYGTYAIVFSLAVWIYYSSLIILLSAEISKYIYELKNPTESLPVKSGVVNFKK